jgi:hypothetical protein
MQQLATPRRTHALAVVMHGRPPAHHVHGDRWTVTDVANATKAIESLLQFAWIVGDPERFQAWLGLNLDDPKSRVSFFATTGGSDWLSKFPPTVRGLSIQSPFAVVIDLPGAFVGGGGLLGLLVLVKRIAIMPKEIRTRRLELDAEASKYELEIAHQKAELDRVAAKLQSGFSDGFRQIDRFQIWDADDVPSDWAEPH